MRKQRSRISLSGQPNRARTEFGKASSLVTPSDSSAARRASTSPVCDPDTGSYMVSTSMNSRTRMDFPPMPSTHPPSTFMTRGACSFTSSGKPLVEDVLGQRDVVVGREHLDVRREPRVDQGTRMPILRRSETFGWVRQRSCVTGHLPASLPPLGSPFVVVPRQITSAS